MKIKKFVYDHGLPYSEKLQENIKAQIKRVENKRASMILIDGAVGTGKTTLAVEIANEINKIHKLPNIKLKIKDHPQIALGGKEFTGCFRECNKQKLPVVIYDEGGDFSRRGAITQFNAMINRLFETYRGFKIIVIICLPNFNVLDNLLFENNIPRMLIHIKDRSKNYGSFRVYSLSQMNWIRYWADKLPKGAKHKCYSNVLPNFYGQFLNLPKEQEKALDKLSTYGKKSVLVDTEIKLKGLKSYDDLAKACNRSQLWVSLTLKKLKIKYKTIIGRKRYFSKDVLDVLYSKLEEIKENETRGRKKKRS